MLSSSTRFSDIQNHWARLFIETLAQSSIVTGFPNRTFCPNYSMTRASNRTGGERPQLSWKAVDNADIRSWTLYKQNGTTWTLEQIFPGVTRDATLVPGTYALCAVDRMANESAGVVVSVS